MIIETLGNGRYKTASASLLDNTVTPKRVGMYAEVFNLSVLNSKQYCVAVDVVGDKMKLLLNATSGFAGSMQANHVLSAKCLLGGFNVEGLDNRHIVCFAGGSGLAGIIPVVRHVLNNTSSIVDVIYLESDASHDISIHYPELYNDRVKLHFAATQGVLSTNEHTPILGMLTSLTGCQPIVFLQRPVYFACGPKGLINRLKSALIPVHCDEHDFRLNF